MKSRIIILVVVLVCLCGWCLYQNGYQKGYSVATDKVQQQAVQQQAEAIQKERELNAQLQTKLENIEHEKQQTNRANQSMRNELGRLQQYVNANSAKLSAHTASTGQPESNEVTRGWTLLNQCAERYAGVAEVADQQRDALAQWQVYGEIIEEMQKSYQHGFYD